MTNDCVKQKHVRTRQKNWKCESKKPVSIFGILVKHTQSKSVTVKMKNTQATGKINKNAFPFFSAIVAILPICSNLSVVQTNMAFNTTVFSH